MKVSKQNPTLSLNHSKVIVPFQGRWLLFIEADMINDIRQSRVVWFISHSNMIDGVNVYKGLKGWSDMHLESEHCW
jgi:hypothetical protein